MRYTNLAQILLEKKECHDTGITFIGAHGNDQFLSYAELYVSALRSLSFLQERGIKKNDHIILQLDENKSFVIIFWACILGGIVPIPLTVGLTDEHKQKFLNIWSFLTEAYVIISQANLLNLRQHAERHSAFSEIQARALIEEDVLAANGLAEIVSAIESDVAFIQFSSGSTGIPKGVILKHENLLVNMAAISKASEYRSNDRTISWMPLTHDMGLIGFHLNPMFSGMHQYLMPTQLFIRRPGLWLEKASFYKATILCSPNFGYKYTLTHFDPSATNVNLSAVRLFYNGAEPISERICREFLEEFSSSGLKANAMCPVYGLAEGTLAVSISSLLDEVVSVTLVRKKLRAGERISFCQRGENRATFVNVGKPIENCSVRITDNQDRPVNDEILGHIQIKGNSVTAGYYNNRKETEKVTTQDGWLRTGDLGFMLKGALYVTGRDKDIIFINGQNFYPHDIERLSEEVPGIGLNKIVVTGFFNDVTEREEAIAFVFHRGSIEAFVPMVKHLRSHVSLHAGLALDRILPVKNIPRTTSGKLQRFRLLEQYREGLYLNVEETLALQLALMEASQVAEVLPETSIEARLIFLWRQVLNDKSIGPLDNFFECGGNSLKAAEIIAIIRNEFEVELPFNSFYEAPTIRQLAENLNSSFSKKCGTIPDVRMKRYYPASFAQKRLYYLWRVDDQSTAYNIPIAFEINGNLSINRLEDCIRQLIDRHESLRMSFRLGRMPEFVLHSEVNFLLESQPAEDSDLGQTLRTMVRPFDLNIAPLLRVKLIKISDQRFILFADFHHIVFDGVSVTIFVDELFKLYSGRDLERSLVRYSAYASWERKVVRKENKRLKNYWKKILEEVPALQLPLDFQRPPVFDSRGTKTMFHLDATVTSALKMLARDNACTLQIVMLTLYEILLSTYTGSNDIIIGIPIDRRTHTDLRRTVGMLVNTVAIKCEMSDDLPLGEQIKKIRDVVWEALRHADFPFEKLIGMTGTTRDISRNPVFDTMFVYQDMRLVKSINEELSFERHFFDPGIAKFDITLEVYENGGSMDCLIEYASSLFKEQTISRLITHFCNLVSDAARHPQKRLSELVLISASEFNEYVIKYNDSASPYDADKTLCTLFEEVVKNYPDRIAVEYENQILTFNEINQKVEEQASFLTVKGFGPQSIGAVLLPNSPDLIVSILAILKVGGIYLPVDVDLPLERIRSVIRDSRCSIVVSDTAGISRLGELAGHDSCRTFNIEEDWMKQLPIRNSRYTISSEDAAYVLYTSGTSGAPKGVVITHGSVVNYVTWAAKQYLSDTVVAFPLFTSISFDLTVTSVFVPLITGSRIVIYNDNERAMSIERILKEDKVDLIKLTPSHLRLISENHSLDLSNSRVRTLIVGGEQLDTQLAKTIHERFRGNVTIFNEYGPTEATVGCMIHKFRPDEERPCVAIGIPAANTRIYLLDKYMRPVPIGVTGEIYIGGDGLAKGYLHSETLTHSKFLSDPFISGALIYKTGDLAKRLPGGELEYIGRLDRQVKMNGHRIELQEIESCLTGYPDISAAFATFRSRGNNNNILYGYFTSDVAVDIQDLRNFMVARLPRYMVPVHFVKLDKIPLTTNGKIDHSALPDYKDSAHSPNDTSTLREIDRTFMEVWRDLMGSRAVAMRDNFFELGGDSIKAVQLASRLREKGITVSVKEILTHQTIQAIIPYIGITNEVNLYDQNVAAGFLERAPIEAWFFSRHFRNQNYYNQSVVLRLNKVVDIDALRHAFVKLIEHHDGLRLNYDPVRMCMFYNNTHLRKDFELLEYRAQNGQYTDVGFDLFCTAVKGSFDITSTLLLKAAVITSGKSTDLLFITAHHLIIDGFSWRILLADLRNFYNAFLSGQAVDVPKKTASVKEWRESLWKLIESGKFGEQENHWQDLSNPFTIPQDYAARDWSVSNARTVRGHLDRFNIAALLKYGAKHKLEMNVILTAALACALQEWTGAKTFIVELENHGRHLKEIDVSRTIGWFTTMHNIKLEWSGRSLDELLNSVKASIANVPSHGIGQGIREHLTRDDGQRGARLTELRMNYLGQFDRELANELFTYISNQSGTNVDVCNQMTAKIAVDIMIFDGELILDITYNVGAHKESTINWLKEQLLSSVNLILQHIQKADDPKLVPSDFDAIDLEQAELDALFK